MSSAERNGTESAPKSLAPALIIVMGVSGCGKSTLASNLAALLGVPYRDGDDLHPKSNVEKMSMGQPLTDQDREPWLALIRKTAETVAQSEEEDRIAAGLPEGSGPNGVVIACSALKQYYRDILRGRKAVSHAPPPTSDLPPDTEATTQLLEEKHQDLSNPAPATLRVYFVYIHGFQETLEQRMTARKGHFMKVDMLKSQLATLEDPRGEENVVWVKLEDSPEKQASDAVDGLRNAGFQV